MEEEGGAGAMGVGFVAEAGSKGGGLDVCGPGAAPWRGRGGGWRGGEPACEGSRGEAAALEAGDAAREDASALVRFLCWVFFTADRNATGER